MIDSASARGGLPAGAGERGSALLISLMVMVILTLLGIAYLLMAETENQIAINQRNASQVLYTAESGAKAVVEWINNPVGGFSVPTTADVDRTLRWLDLNPAGGDGVWDTAADGTAGKERYKQTTNLLFQKPYRGTIEEAFLGSEDNPDIRVNQAFLDTLNSRILGTGAGTLADPDPQATYGKITQIDIYAPPILVVNTNRTRHGVATIKVTAQKVRTIGGVDRVLAERTVKVVVNEINYPSAGGPLQSCSTTTWGGDFTVHWGKASVQTGATLSITPGNFDIKFNTGMGHGAGSPTQYFLSETDFNNWYNANDGENIEDPWFKLLTGDLIANISAPPECTNPTGAQPCPPSTTGAGWNGGNENDNIFQNQGPIASCPSFDYALFKNVAQRGGSGIYYYGAYNTGTSTWKEGGFGSPVTYKQATDNRPGFFFFDTADGNPPQYDGSNDCTNCTGALSYNSADKWGSGLDAFIYLNAASFATTGGGTIGYTRNLNAPGEPYHDTNGNAQHDGTEPFVNLNYPATIGGTYQISVGGTRDAQGPAISVDDIAVHGIMHLSGTFASGGNGKYYGAVVAHKVDTGATVDMWYNERISTNGWPPANSPVPKVYVSVWEVDNL